MRSSVTNARFTFVAVEPNTTDNKLQYDKSLASAHTARVLASHRDAARCERRLQAGRTSVKEPSASPGTYNRKCRSTRRIAAADEGNHVCTDVTDSNVYHAEHCKSITDASPIRGKSPLCQLIGEPREGSNRQSIFLYNSTILSAYLNLIVRSLDKMARQKYVVSSALQYFFSRDSVFNAFSAMVLWVHADVQNRQEISLYGQMPGNTPKSTARRILTYSAKAIKALREDFEGGNHDNLDTFMAMVTLANFEARVGNYAGRDHHRKAIGRLLAQRGGLSSLDDNVKLYVFSQEFWWTLETGTTILDELQCMCRWDDRKSVSYSHAEMLNMEESLVAEQDDLSWTEGVDVSTIPTGFRPLLNKRLLSVSAVEAIQRIKAVLLTDSTNWPREATSYHDLQTPFTSLLNTCVEAFAEGHGRALSDLTTVKLMTGLGLFLYYYAVTNDMEFWATIVIWPLAARIRDIFTGKLMLILSAKSPLSDTLFTGRAAPWCSNEEHELLVWLIYLALASWVTSEKVLATEGHDLAAAAYQALGKNVSCHNDCCGASRSGRRELLSRFLWDEKLNFGLIERSIRSHEPVNGNESHA